MIIKYFSFMFGMIFLTASLAVSAALPSPLKIAISNDSYPYMFVDAAGEPAGLVVDYWLEMAHRQQVEVQFVAADWPDTLSLLDQKLVHLHGGMANTPERSARYLLGDMQIGIYSNVFVHRDVASIASLQDLYPYAIGVVEHSGPVESLQQLLPGAITRSYINASQMYDAALSGRIKAFTGLDRLTSRYEQYEELNRQFPLYRKVPLKKMDLSYAVFDSPELYQQLQLLTAVQGTAFSDALERRWLSNEYDDNTLLLGVSIGNQPYMHVSQSGEAQGLFVDIWKLWADKTGKKITFIPDFSNNNLLSLSKGRIDAHIAFSGRYAPELALDKAYHLYNFNAAFFYPNQRPVSNLAQLADVVVGIYQSSEYQDELQQRYPSVTFQQFGLLDDMVKAALSGQIAGFFAAEAVIPLRLQQLDLWQEFSQLEGSLVSAPLYVLVRHSDSEELQQQIHQGFAAISLDELETLEKQWISNEKQQYFPKHRQHIPLTAGEQQWLSTYTPVKVGLLNNWPPMEFIDDKNKASGVTVDILQLLTERTGVTFQFIGYDDFDDMLQALQRSEVDMLTHLSELPERRQYAVFSDEFWALRWALVGHHSAPEVNAASELSGKRVAINKDYQLSRDLAVLVPGVNIVQVESLSEGLQLLGDNTVDYVLDALEIAGMALRRADYVNIRMQLLDELPSYPSRIAVRADYQPLLSILNKGVRSIGQQERQQLYQRWFDFQITESLNKKHLLRLILQISGAVLLLLGFVLVWNLSLRREIGLRRQAEDKMRFMATHDELTNLPNRGLLQERLEQALLQHARHNEMMALLFIDLDGFKEINDQYGHNIGDELLYQLAQLLQSCVRRSDTVARLGGDEFVILLTGLLGPEDAAIIAEKLLSLLQQPLVLSVGAIQVGASIGIALYPKDGTEARELLKTADNLMYRVKQQGKSQYCFSDKAFC